MKKYLWALILCFLSAAAWFFFPSSPKYQHDLAICAMFKNEAPWLKEWVVYHHDILGFTHFYLYNNDSTDNYDEVLRPFIDKGIVELIDWNSADETHRNSGWISDNPFSWYLYQIAAYNDCLKKRALGKAKWVATIDIDEYIVPVHGVHSFHANLRSAEKRRKGSIKFSWRMFGTSHIWDLKPGELLTEKLILRGADDNYSHNWGKCMHRPEAVPFCHIHDCGTLDKTDFQAGRLNEGFRNRHVNPDEIRIHHYWSRTEKYCLEKRGTKEPKSERGEPFDLIEDQAMAQYIPALKKAMDSYR